MSTCRAQWVKEGNDNVPCLDCVNDREMVFEITSMNFDGCRPRPPSRAHMVTR